MSGADDTITAALLACAEDAAAMPEWEREIGEETSAKISKMFLLSLDAKKKLKDKNQSPLMLDARKLWLFMAQDFISRSIEEHDALIEYGRQRQEIFGGDDI